MFNHVFITIYGEICGLSKSFSAEKNSKKAVKESMNQSFILWFLNCSTTFLLQFIVKYVAF
jgi:hypothetical protein